MAKTTDFELCKTYLMNYIENMKKQINLCQFELAKYSSQTCPIVGLSFEQMIHHLKQLVDRERIYLSKRNNDQLIKFKEEITEKDLLKTLPKTNGQVNRNRFSSMIYFLFLGIFFGSINYYTRKTSRNLERTINV
jgi:hypothetical protein